MTSSSSFGAIQTKPVSPTCLLWSGLGSQPGRAPVLKFILYCKCALAGHQMPCLLVRTESLEEPVSGPS